MLIILAVSCSLMILFLSSVSFIIFSGSQPWILWNQHQFFHQHTKKRTVAFMNHIVHDYSSISPFFPAPQLCHYHCRSTTMYKIFARIIQMVSLPVGVSNPRRHTKRLPSMLKVSLASSKFDIYITHRFQMSIKVFCKCKVQMKKTAHNERNSHPSRTFPFLLIILELHLLKLQPQTPFYEIVSTSARHMNCSILFPMTMLSMKCQVLYKWGICTDHVNLYCQDYKTPHNWEKLRGIDI